MIDINAKIEEIRVEYAEVTGQMRQLSDQYNALEKRKIELEGAYKTLTEITQEENGENNDTQGESE